MEPNEVAAVYLAQANKIYEFMNKIKEEDNSNDTLKIMLLTICQKYYELLLTLSVYTPLLKTYNVKFFKVNSLEPANLSEPPFEKDFFNNHKI